VFIIENERIGLRPYTHGDDHDMYMCWKDIDTQKGYNGIFTDTFEQFSDYDINRFKFWVVVVDKYSNENVGVLRLGLDEVCPDLAIWIYPKYRNMGYGTVSFRLALSYIFNHYEYNEISAGCYCDNKYSMKVLHKTGFVRHPDGDETETNCFTGEKTTQMSFRIKKEDFELLN